MNYPLFTLCLHSLVNMFTLLDLRICNFNCSNWSIS